MNAMVKEIPVRQDSELENFKRQLRLAIADGEAQLTAMKRSLAELEGVKVQTPPSSSIYSHMSAIDAAVSYIKDRGKPVERIALVKDLVMLGVCWDSKSRGGPQADIERSISRFLKYGRRKGDKPVLRAKGSMVSLHEWKD